MFNFLKNKSKGAYLAYKYGIRNFDASKAILVSMDEIKFNRYLYTFVKMLFIEGYFVVLNIDYEGIAHLTTDPYSNNIFKEGLLFRRNKNNTFLKKIKINPDYFNAVYNTSLNNTCVIPISKHPLMYNVDTSNLSLKMVRKNVVFFAGTTRF